MKKFGCSWYDHRTPGATPPQPYLPCQQEATRVIRVLGTVIGLYCEKHAKKIRAVIKIQYGKAPEIKTLKGEEERYPNQAPKIMANRPNGSERHNQN